MARACHIDYKTIIAWPHLQDQLACLSKLAEGLTEAAAGLAAGFAAAVAAHVTLTSGAAEAAGAAAAFAFVAAYTAAASSSAATTTASAVSIDLFLPHPSQVLLLHLALSTTAPLPVQLPTISVQLWFYPLQGPLLWRLTLQSQKHLQN